MATLDSTPAIRRAAENIAAATPGPEGGYVDSQPAILDLTAAAQTLPTIEAQEVSQATATAFALAANASAAAARLGETQTPAAWTATTLAADFAATATARAEERLDKTATALAALADDSVMQQKAALDIERLRTQAAFESQITAVLIAAAPLATAAAGLLLLAFLTLWLCSSLKDWEQKRKDESLRRRLRSLNGLPVFADDDGWKPVRTIEGTTVAAPSALARVSAAVNERRKDDWNRAAWLFTKYAGEIRNATTGAPGSFSAHDLVQVYRSVSRLDWDSLTGLLVEAGVLLQDNHGTRWGQEEGGTSWNTPRLRAALLTGRLKLAHPVDAAGNILPAPAVKAPWRATAVTDVDSPLNV